MKKIQFFFFLKFRKRTEVKMVESWARQIGAQVSTTYSSQVTHVIVQADAENCAQRTLKFLFGVANGNWIVGIDWVRQSIRNCNLPINELAFEALDMDGEDGPRRSRMRTSGSKLFRSFEFCCQEPFSDVTVDQLRELLELCGALTVKDPSQLSKIRRNCLIVVQIDDEDDGIHPTDVERKAADWFDRMQILTVSREWVLDCLASYRLLPIRNQLIGQHPESLLRMMKLDDQLLSID